MAADKAYSSHANRTYLRQRGIIARYLHHPGEMPWPTIRVPGDVIAAHRACYAADANSPDVGWFSGRPIHSCRLLLHVAIYLQ
ncbi:hypothetical protein FHR32_000851 [Streptosporangium album]|uniref:Uncharacterized protein n=1 Tax=Streptosporangium album TaxID=47479 RepID=A0A7W7RQY0_9ACTN|nr:hypothetical protein [Streptosporangium album]